MLFSTRVQDIVARNLNTTLNIANLSSTLAAFSDISSNRMTVIEKTIRSNEEIYRGNIILLNRSLKVEINNVMEDVLYVNATCQALLLESHKIRFWQYAMKQNFSIWAQAQVKQTETYITNVTRKMNASFARLLSNATSNFLSLYERASSTLTDRMIKLNLSVVSLAADAAASKIDLTDTKSSLESSINGVNLTAVKALTLASKNEATSALNAATAASLKVESTLVQSKLNTLNEGFHLLMLLQHNHTASDDVGGDLSETEKMHLLGNFTAADAFANFSAVVTSRLDNFEEFAMSLVSKTTNIASETSLVNASLREQVRNIRRDFDLQLHRKTEAVEASAAISIGMLNSTIASELFTISTESESQQKSIALMNATLGSIKNSWERARINLEQRIVDNSLILTELNQSGTLQKMYFQALIDQINGSITLSFRTAVQQAFNLSTLAAQTARDSLAGSFTSMLRVQAANISAALENMGRRLNAVEQNLTLSMEEEILEAKKHTSHLNKELTSLRQRIVWSISPFGISALTAGVGSQPIQIMGATIGDNVSFLISNLTGSTDSVYNKLDCAYAEDFHTLVEHTPLHGQRVFLTSLSAVQEHNISYALCLNNILQINVPLIRVHPPIFTRILIPSHGSIGIVSGATNASILLSGICHSVSIKSDSSDELGCRGSLGVGTTLVGNTTIAYIPPTSMPGKYLVCANNSLQPVSLRVVPQSIRYCLSRDLVNSSQNGDSIQLNMIDLAERSRVAFLPASTLNCQGAHAVSKVMTSSSVSLKISNFTKYKNYKVCYAEYENVYEDESYSDQGINVSPSEARVHLPSDVVVGIDYESSSSAPSSSQIKIIHGIALDSIHGHIYVSSMQRNEILHVNGGLRRNTNNMSAEEERNSVSLTPVAQNLQFVMGIAFDEQRNEIFAVSIHEGRGRLTRIEHPADTSITSEVHVVADAETETLWVNVAIDYTSKKDGGVSVVVLTRDGAVLRIQQKLSSTNESPTVNEIATGFAFSTYAGVCIDSVGIIYVTEMLTGTLYRIDKFNNKEIVTTGLISPTDCEITSQNQVLVSNLLPGYIWKVHVNDKSKFVQMHSGNVRVELYAVGLNFPVGMSIDGLTGDLLVTELAPKLSPDGTNIEKLLDGKLVRVAAVK